MKRAILLSKKVTLLAFVLLISMGSAFSADLILSAPPRENPERGLKTYGPLAAYLTKLFGTKVTYKHPGRWITYQRDMRNDKYDIVLDGPHFSSWRIAHLGHEPIVKLPGKLVFLLLADKSNAKIDSPSKLIGKRICAIAPPHLSTMSIMSHFQNPVRQPIIKGIEGGMKATAKAFFSKKARCEALVLRNVYLRKKVKKEDQNSLKVLLTSKAMPNQALTASKRVSAELKEKMRRELSRGKGIASTRPILKRFAGKAKSFLPVLDGEYDNYNMLLEGVVWGW